MIETTLHGADRRRACRYAVAHCETSLGWWVDSLFVTAPARLINVSWNGCLVGVERTSGLTESQTIWVHPHVAASQDWIEGRIILLRTPVYGKGKVSVLFHNPIPYELFKTLICGGHHLGAARARSAPEHDWNQFQK